MTTIARSRFVGKRWTCGSVTKTSLRHLAHGHAGQDAAYACLKARPIVLVADGRGSSEHSEIGAAAVPDCFASTVNLNESLVAQSLDMAGLDPALREERWAQFAQILHRALVARQKELARAHSLEPVEMEFTLAAAVVGTEYVGILQRGDSSVAIERRLEMELVLPPDRGEFANETRFISPDEGTCTPLGSRILPMGDVTGLVAFTDGLSQRWIDARTLAVAPGVGRIVRNLGDRIWDQPRLDTFMDRPFWQDGDDDDKGVAYLAMRTTRPVSRPRRRQ